MSDDHSPGDARAPYSNEGGPAGRHAQTHDVAAEQRTNPTGPEPRDPTFDEQLAQGRTTSAPDGHTDESIPGIADKDLHRRFQELSPDELRRLSILEPGTQLEQGGVYLDLNDLERGPFKAIGGQVATPGTRYIAKRDTDYELWNRLVGQDEDVDVVRPETEG